MNNKHLLSIFLVVFVDLLDFGLILPLLPFYAEQYGEVIELLHAFPSQPVILISFSNALNS